MVGLLDGYDLSRLDTAVVHREGRQALLEAYKDTEVFGLEFPDELPAFREGGNYQNPEGLECAGLEWVEKRGLIAREYTLKASGRYSAMVIPHLIHERHSDGSLLGSKGAKQVSELPQGSTLAEKECLSFLHYM